MFVIMVFNITIVIIVFLVSRNNNQFVTLLMNEKIVDVIIQFFDELNDNQTHVLLYKLTF